MNLKQGTVYMDCYKRLRVNGWPKLEAAKAARRHVKHLERKRQLGAEVSRILSEQK